MKKIKILEVTEIDLTGKRFNGYDMIHDLDNNIFDIKQAVLTKKSDDKQVIKMMNTTSEYKLMDKFIELESDLSIKNVLSITAPNLLKLKEYQEADIIHFHQFHNANLSLYYLKKIASEKKVIISLHDPWSFTGHCVYPMECERYKNGCTSCPHLDFYFPIKEDTSSDMWQLKKNIYDSIDADIVIYSGWMEECLKDNKIFENQKNIHKISFGIDEKRFSTVTKEEARAHFSIPEDATVFFTRAQKGFKGTPYTLEALKKLDANKNLYIITCDTPNLLDEVKDKFNIIDLGLINDKEMAYAMNVCDAFLMPSTAESFGLMAIEAMSCSKPVVVFNNSALPSVTHAPECGYLVKNCDSEDLAKTLKFIIDNPDDVKRRGKLAKKIVKEEYTLDNYNKKFTKLYQEVYKRNKEYKNYQLRIKDDQNTNQFKYILNDYTVYAFGTKHPITKELLYEVEEKRINNYKFSFSDASIGDLIIDYTIKLKELVDKYKIGDLEERKKIQLEKIMYFIKNNPKYINKIIKRI